MSTNTPPIEELDLHAYVDGQLGPERRAEVEAHLAANPTAAERVQAYRKQNDMLRALFDPVAEEPIPQRMRAPTRRFAWLPPLRHAAVLAWLSLGGILGWTLHGSEGVRPNHWAALPQQAAIAHAVYTPEVLHPVEVGADQEAHLVKWLSKRLDTQLKAPHLAEAGYQLMGGRLLPGGKGPAAQFMYQDAQGQRLTLYVRTGAGDNRETAFRFEQEGKVGVFYWVDGPLGYALSGEMKKPELLKVANVVYRQLNP